MAEHRDSLFDRLAPEDAAALMRAVERIEKRTFTRRLFTCAGMPADWGRCKGKIRMIIKP